VRCPSLAQQRRRRERREQRWNLAGGVLGFAIAVAFVLFNRVDTVLDFVAGVPVAATGAGSGPLALVFGAASLAYVFLVNCAGTGTR